MEGNGDSPPTEEGWRRYFRPLKPGEELPPPPRELVLWTRQTTCALMGGMMIGLATGWQKARDPKTPPAVGAPGTPANLYRRLSVILSREALSIGGGCGLFAATFSALSLASQSLRQADDPLNSVVAGGITGGTFALRLKISPLWGAVFGSISGGTLGGLVWAMDHYLMPELAEESVVPATDPSNNKPDVPVTLPVQNVVSSLESSLLAQTARKSRSHETQSK